MSIETHEFPPSQAMPASFYQTDISFV